MYPVSIEKNALSYGARGHFIDVGVHRSRWRLTTPPASDGQQAKM
jgi:hypothetical protein